MSDVNTIEFSIVFICRMQVVLLTDGMDTRPYRLNWPKSTVVFDISPDNVFKRAAQKLEGLYCFYRI